MKAPPFGYVRARTLAEAATMLAQCGEGAQILAGGQSLVPTLNLRLSRPGVLVDINRVSDAVPLREIDGMVEFGATVRHSDVERSALVQERVPLLAQAITHVGHPAVRNRGTPCGSVALADPAAEIPACALALGARIVLQGPDAVRTVMAADYFRGLYETVREPTEVVTKLQFPQATPHDRFGFVELARRHGDFAIVGIVVAARVDGGRIEQFRLVVFGCEPIVRVSAAAAALAVGRSWTGLPVREIAAEVARALDPMENAQGDANTKRRQARALAERVLHNMGMQNAA